MPFGIVAQALVETLRVSVPTVWEAALGRLTPERVDERLARWSAALLAEARVELVVNGAEHARPDVAYVVMSNHQSLYDIPVLFQSLRRRRIRMIAKKELFAVPIWGRAMRDAGFPALDRGDRERAKATLKEAEQALRSGTSIWIAPEGTRSPSGDVGPFRKGGFHLAAESGAPILPVTISGTRNVLPARSSEVRPGQRVVVTIHAPIEPERLAAGELDELVQSVRERIARAL